MSDPQQQQPLYSPEQQQSHSSSSQQQQQPHSSHQQSHSSPQQQQQSPSSPHDQHRSSMEITIEQAPLLDRSAQHEMEEEEEEREVGGKEDVLSSGIIGHFDVQQSVPKHINQLLPVYQNSIYLVLLLGIVESVEWSIVLPSFFGFAQKVGASQDLYGVLFSLSFLVQLMVTPLLRCFHNVIPTVEMFMLLAACKCASWVLYANSFSVWLLAASRILIGLTGSCSPLLLNYIALTTHGAKRAHYQSTLSLMQLIGFLVGSAIASLIGVIPNVPSITVFITQHNAPGYIVALMHLVLMFAMCFAMRDAPAPLKTNVQPRPLLPDLHSLTSCDLLEIAMCLITHYLLVSTLTIFEILVAPLTVKYGWLSFEVGGLFTAVGMMAILGYLLHSMIARYTKNEKWPLILGSLGGAVGINLLFNLHLDETRLFVGSLIIGLSLSSLLATHFSSQLLVRLLPQHFQATVTLLFTTVTLLSKCFASMCSPFVLARGGNFLFLLSGLSLIVSAVMFAFVNCFYCTRSRKTNTTLTNRK